MAIVREITWIAMIALGALFYTGFGITRLLAFGPIRRVEVLLIPFLGFSLISIVSAWCGWLGWPTAVIATVILVLSTLFNLLAVVRCREIPLEILGHLPVLALAFIAFAMAVYPVWQSRALGPIGTNSDQVLYANIASHLEEGGLLRTSTSEWKPAMVQLSVAGETGFPLGFSYLHALVDTLSGYEAHETFALVSAISLALSVLSYASLAVCLFGAGWRGTLLIALLAAISPTLLGVHYDSDAMQVMSFSLVPLAFGLSVLAVEQSRRDLLLPALLLAAVFVTHPVAALTFSLGPTVLYVALRGVWQRRRLASARGTVALLGSLAGVLALPGMLDVGKFLWHMRDFEFSGQVGESGQSAGWLELYGLTQHRLPAGMDPLAFFQASTFFLAICVAAITLYGARGMKGVARTAMLSLGILYVPLLIFCRYGLDDPEVFFNALAFATFPAFTSFTLGCERLLAPKPRWGGRGKTCVVALILVVVAINAIYLTGLSRWAATVAFDFPSLLALRHVKELIRHPERIHVRDASGTPLLWIAYFFKDYELSLAHALPASLGSDGRFSQKAIRADFVLIDKGVPLPEPWAMTPVYENNRYRILQKDPSVRVHVDFRTGASMLVSGQELRLDILPAMLVVDDQLVPLALPLESPPAILRLGVYAPAGATLEVGTSGWRETLHPSHDLYRLEVPLEQLPMTVTLANAGTRGILLEGWLALVAGQGKDADVLPQEELFERLKEEVLPGSGIFVADGWHGMEGGQKRWTAREAFSLFRNPLKPIVLQLEGFLPFPPDGTSPGKARVLVNGHVLGELHEPGHFAQRYALPAEILNTSGGTELKLSLDRSLNLRTLGLSEDDRELGMLVTRLALLDLDLPPNGIIDIGTPGARKYLGQGWSHDEPLEGNTLVWAAAQESWLQISLPESRDFRVEMRLLPFAYASAPPQEVGISVNGQHLQDLLLDGGRWQIHSFKLPQAFVVPGINTFRFNYSYAVAPATIMPGNPDRRTLAGAFDFIAFLRE